MAGSGSGPGFMVFSTDGPDAIFVVQIDTPTGLPMRMGVDQGTLKDKKTLVIGQDGEELNMLADSEVTSRLHAQPARRRHDRVCRLHG